MDSMTTETIETHKQTNSVRPAQGVYKVRQNVPFQILVTSFSKRSVTLPKSMLTTGGTELSNAIVA